MILWPKSHLCCHGDDLLFENVTNGKGSLDLF